MSTEMLERRFAAIAGRGNVIDLGVVDVARTERHLLPMRPKNAFRRRGPAYVRQGEWFFVPTAEIDPPVTHVLFDEPLPRRRGKAHVMQFAYRRGQWSQMVHDPEVFAKGAIRHPDHATVVLRGWHRVAMNTEQAARPMRHATVLD